MSLVLRVADEFLTDSDDQVAWYFEQAGEDVAKRYRARDPRRPRPAATTP